MSINKEKVVECLNQIMEVEYAGVVRYSHYALMVFGHNRIPICGWLRDQATESLTHANQAGEHITALEGHPSLKIGKLLESHKHGINDILNESLDHELNALEKYNALLAEVEGKCVWLEEYCREMIMEEEIHVAEVRKMIRAPK